MKRLQEVQSERPHLARIPKETSGSLDSRTRDEEPFVNAAIDGSWRQMFPFRDDTELVGVNVINGLFDGYIGPTSQC